jgi:2'-5' RNA ligase
VDHVIVPLDVDHTRCLRVLRRRAGLPASPDTGHVTLLTFDGVDRATAQEAVEQAGAALLPLTIRASGYGLFVDESGVVSLHVPVVRTDALNALRTALAEALTGCGARIAPWTDAERWTPHITVSSEALPIGSLAAAVEALAGVHHPSWRIPVEDVRVVCGRNGQRTVHDLELGGVRPGRGRPRR